MQSRLEEEEEAKVALMSRIQRLTKLILVSTKNTFPGCLSDVPSHQRSHSAGKDDVSVNEFEYYISALICLLKIQRAYLFVRFYILNPFFCGCSEENSLCLVVKMSNFLHEGEGKRDF